VKLVLGVHHYPPDHLAGAELAVERSARWLAARGHAVEVVAVRRIDAGPDPAVTTEERDGVTVHRLDLHLIGQRRGLAFRHRDDALGAWFARLFERLQPDLFHLHSGYLLTASSLAAAGGLGIPTALTLHDYWFFCPRTTLLRSNGAVCAGQPSPADCAWCLQGERRRLSWVDRLTLPFGNGAELAPRRLGPRRWLLDRSLSTAVARRQRELAEALRAVDAVIASAPLPLELAAAAGVPADRLYCVALGLAPGRSFRARHRPADGRLRIGYLGQIAPQKGVHVLLRAFRRLTGRATALELHLFGDRSANPVYSAKLERLAAGDDRIQFHGRYPNAEVGRLLGELDLVVVPSLWYEVGPMVTLEARAAGLPVVTARLPNLERGVRHDLDGLLFRPGDDRDLARQLQRLIDEPLLLERLAGNVPPVRSADQELEEIEALYRQLVGARAAPPTVTCGSPDV
jgi:glycosyltransferase involved in cell wall biosynthesis